MKEFGQIKKTIKENNKIVYWFDEKGNILEVSHTKNKSKIKKTKYEGILYRFNITFHSGKKPGQGGPIAVNIRTFTKEKQNISPLSGYKNGVIWFPKEFIEDKGWNEKYMRVIHSIVSRKKFEFKIGIYNYDEL